MTFNGLISTFFGDAHAKAEEEKAKAAADAKREALRKTVTQARNLEGLIQYPGWREYVGLLESRLSVMQRDLEQATAENMPRIQAEIKVLRFALDVVPNTVRQAQAAKEELDKVTA